MTLNEWDKFKFVIGSEVSHEDVDKTVLIQDDVVYLPKFYSGTINPGTINGDKYHGKNVEIEVPFDPRPEQVECVSLLSSMYSADGMLNGIVKAAPGWGKTFTSLKLFSIFKKQSIIVVPNNVLEKQWTDAIIEFTNLTLSDIGVIQGSDIINITNALNNPIIIVKVQSLMAQFKTHSVCLLQDVYNSVGVVVYDEAHVSGSAELFAKTSFMFNTNTIIGMTATPYRKGLNEFLLKNSIGDLIYDSDHQNLVPEIHTYNLNIEFSQSEKNKLKYMANIDYVRFLATYNSILTGKDAYFEYIADWVVYRKQLGHETAILFSTNAMVDKLYKILIGRGYVPAKLIGETGKNKRIKKATLDNELLETIIKYYFVRYPKRKKLPPELTVGQTFNSKIKKIISEISELDVINIEIPADEELPSEMEIAKTNDIIISNFQNLSAGFDKSSLGTIIFGSPQVGKVGVIQSLGRITRVNPNKKQDVVGCFMFTTLFTEMFDQIAYTLERNIKVQYPTSKFIRNGFD